MASLQLGKYYKVFASVQNSLKCEVKWRCGF